MTDVYLVAWGAPVKLERSHWYDSYTMELLSTRGIGVTQWSEAQHATAGLRRPPSTILVIVIYCILSGTFNF